MGEKLINLIASVDLANGAGDILYVNPLGSATSPPPASPKWQLQPTVSPSGVAAGPAIGAAAAAAGFELRIENAEGIELGRYKPNIKLSKCELSPDVATTSAPTASTGMIDDVIPFVQGMKRVVLLHDGKEVSRFEAGDTGVGTGMPVMLEMAAPADATSNKRTLGAAAPPTQGVKYTVQVKPKGTSAWQTIAVGRDTPSVELDRNQFPGVNRARVRVLRSTGFDDEIYTEQDLDLDF